MNDPNGNPELNQRQPSVPLAHNTPEPLEQETATDVNVSASTAPAIPAPVAPTWNASTGIVTPNAPQPVPLGQQEQVSAAPGEPPVASTAPAIPAPVAPTWNASTGIVTPNAPQPVPLGQQEQVSAAPSEPPVASTAPVIPAPVAPTWNAPTGIVTPNAPQPVPLGQQEQVSAAPGEPPVASTAPVHAAQQGAPVGAETWPPAATEQAASGLNQESPSQYAYVKPSSAAYSANQPQPAPAPYYNTGATQWVHNPVLPSSNGGFGGGNSSVPPQPFGGGKKNGRNGLAAVALILACAVAGFGGSALGNEVFRGGENTVVYKAPEIGQNIGNGVSEGSSKSISDVAAKSGASVVSIMTENLVTDQFFSGRVVSGAGSGVIISQDGYIITNHHVVEGARSVKVTLPDGSEHDATVVGTDSASDVAVIKISVTNLVPAVISDSDTLQVGDFCIAIGNPMGTLGGTVTDGIVSATNREITIDGNTMSLLQMSAAVSPGNSGGGLFNANGELIGVVNAKSGGQDAEGLGFAIPINTAMKVAEDLMTKGYVAGRPGLGVSVVSITTSQEAAQAQVSQLGVYIAQLTPGGAAEQAGLEVGDRMATMDGQEITSYADINAILKEKAVGDTIDMQVLRDGKLQNVTVVLQELAPEASGR